MARFNGMFAALAATGLLLAQPAAAATADSEGGMFADAPGAAPIVGLIGLVGLIFLIMVISDGDDSSDDRPTSP